MQSYSYSLIQSCVTKPFTLLEFLFTCLKHVAVIKFRIRTFWLTWMTPVGEHIVSVLFSIEYLDAQKNWQAFCCLYGLQGITSLFGIRAVLSLRFAWLTLCLSCTRSMLKVQLEGKRDHQFASQRHILTSTDLFFVWLTEVLWKIYLQLKNIVAGFVFMCVWISSAMQGIHLLSSKKDNSLLNINQCFTTNPFVIFILFFNYSDF